LFGSDCDEEAKASDQRIKVSIGKFAIKKNEIEHAEMKLKEAMNQNPLQTASHFYNLEANKKNGNYILGASKVEKLLTRIRNEIYPKQQEIIFGGKYFIFH